jgi:hypothetical protein
MSNKTEISKNSLTFGNTLVLTPLPSVQYLAAIWIFSWRSAFWRNDEDQSLWGSMVAIDVLGLLVVVAVWLI